MAEMAGPEQRRSLPRHLRDQLYALIVDEKMRAGDQLPSEADLMSTYSVGRSTVREALQILEQDGLVQARQGKGRFVTARVRTLRPLTRLEGVTEMLASRGVRPVNEVLSCVSRDPREDEASTLQLASHQSVVQLERLRTVDKEAVVYSIDVFTRELVPMPMSDVDWSGSLFELLAKFGHMIAYASAKVSAVRLDAAVASKINETDGQPWLLLTQEHVDVQGRPVLMSLDYHRGSDFTFEVQRQRT